MASDYNVIIATTRRRDDIRKPICSSESTAMGFTVRRSANYKPSLWPFDRIQSLSSIYTEEECEVRLDALKNSVRTMIRKVAGSPLSTLEMVDDLQRLGISYHFEDEIKDVLEMIYSNYFKTNDMWNRMDLNLKALGFRLLRQHGYQVPQEIFLNFKDDNQNLKPFLVDNMMGMLNLYEATYHSFEYESIMDDARELTTIYLRENLDKMDGGLLSLVNHALEIPLHWRHPRVETEWFIQVYEKRNGMNVPTLIELAKLDFNVVQAIYLEDLKHVSRWWKSRKWDKKLSFARDRLVECHLWSIGINYQTRFSLQRRNVTKIAMMITTIDDIYDVYATLDELEKFTHVIDRWDVNAIGELPDYMKICFLGLYNLINEITYDTLTNNDFLILPFLKKAWADLCKSYLVEARWYHSGYTPTLTQYLHNASISIATHLILTHINFMTSITSTQEIFEGMKKHDNIVHYTSLILRLGDDLGTSTDEMARGDVPKSIQCYMHESGATEEEARKFMSKLIIDTWKKLNKERTCVNSRFLHEFYEYATNLARTGHFMYNQGDGFGRPDITKSHVLSLLVNPIQI